MNSDAWHYVNGSSSDGPVTEAEIVAMIARGDLRRGTLIWNENLPNWEPVEVHFDMGAVVPPPPPMEGETTMQHAGGIGADGLYVGAPGRSFGEAIKVCFNKYATFKGRASRSEFWWFMLFNTLVGSATSIVDTMFVGVNPGFSPLNTIYNLAVFIPSLAVAVRRLHDIDRSGWWIGGFYILIPVFSVGMIGVFAALDGGAGPGAGIGGLVAVLGIGLLIYALVILVFQCTKGTLGQNRFG